MAFKSARCSNLSAATGCTDDAVSFADDDEDDEEETEEDDAREPLDRRLDLRPFPRPSAL